jgi:uncharacterized protein
MSLQEKISQEIKVAMLAKDAPRLSTLRLLKSAMGYALIERKTEVMADADVVALVQKEIKKRRDSVEQYQTAGRVEQAASETAEIVVLEAFLPKAFSPEDLESLVRATITELGATSKKEMGAVIKAVQAKAAGRADGRAISGLVGKLLP